MDISQPKPNNMWTRASLKRSKAVHEEFQRYVKHTKGRNNWLHPTSTSNRYTALLDEENEYQQRQGGPEDMLNLHQYV
jgi:hypothetical protein